MVKKPIPNNAPKKGTKLQKNLGVSKEEEKRAVANTKVIDVNKRRYFMDEPPMDDG